MTRNDVDASAEIVAWAGTQGNQGRNFSSKVSFEVSRAGGIRSKKIRNIPGNGIVGYQRVFSCRKRLNQTGGQIKKPATDEATLSFKA